MENITGLQGPHYSFEIFPPKGKGNLDAVFATIDGLASLRPDLISVTYGAGGSSRENTVEIASTIQNRYHVPGVAHLTCVGSTLEQTNAILDQLKENGVKTILALRGDRRPGTEDQDGYFKHASELAAHIKANYDFTVLGACYPEKHPEAPSFDEDIRHLKEKADAGVDALISQLFLDNDDFYRFRDAASRAGVNIPIYAGIMPITAPSMLEKVVSMCGASIPHRVRRFTESYGHNATAMIEAGIAYATEQISDLLASGVDGIHIYSMNKVAVTRRITQNLTGILYSLRVKRS